MASVTICALEALSCVRDPASIWVPAYVISLRYILVDFAESADLNINADQEVNSVHYVSPQPDGESPVTFSAKFDQLAGSIFEHCNEAWNHDGDVYDVPQYPIAERQQKVHIVDEIRYR